MSHVPLQQVALTDDGCNRQPSKLGCSCVGSWDEDNVSFCFSAVCSLFSVQENLCRNRSNICEMNMSFRRKFCLYYFCDSDIILLDVKNKFQYNSTNEPSVTPNIILHESTVISITKYLIKFLAFTVQQQWIFS